jgi:lipopolysaccharide transport system ATP-binding protein
MSDSIIQVYNLGKSYSISHEGGKESYTALRDVLANQAKKIFSFPKSLRNESGLKKANTEKFWALKDVSFDINQGDRVGIIGRNGAGKSTLLKILSRITEPTTGEIKIKGRIASLLEVGTGFHPELTGRENIYLNGAILGMSRVEIKRKFDEIVDFAEVEKFLDTPVKRYSSGMYVRLAFAVAAHLEPEILVVDEVLAVGDAQFQKKCLGKMEDVSKNEGRTVLFVSHNLIAIKSLCNVGFFLDQGEIGFTGEIDSCISHYLSKSKKATSNGLIPENSSTYNTGEASYKSIKIKNILFDGKSIYYRAPIVVELELNVFKIIKNIIIDVRVCTNEGIQIVHASNAYDKISLENTKFNIGIHNLEVTFTNSLQPGNYSLTIGMHHFDGTTIDYVENIFDFEVLKMAYNDIDNYPYTWNMGIVHAETQIKIN